MTDLPTLESWITRIGFTVKTIDASTLRIEQAGSRGGDSRPPFFVQWTPNWVVLSILPVLKQGEYRAEDLARRLLLANREMRLAKFAFDANHAVVLSAELPTESLDYSEVESAIVRMVQYTNHWRQELLGR